VPLLHWDDGEDFDLQDQDADVNEDDSDHANEEENLDDDWFEEFEEH